MPVDVDHTVLRFCKGGRIMLRAVAAILLCVFVGCGQNNQARDKSVVIPLEQQTVDLIALIQNLEKPIGDTSVELNSCRNKLEFENASENEAGYRELKRVRDAQYVLADLDATRLSLIQQIRMASDQLTKGEFPKPHEIDHAKIDHKRLTAIAAKVEKQLAEIRSAFQLTDDSPLLRTFGLMDRMHALPERQRPPFVSDSTHAGAAANQNYKNAQVDIRDCIRDITTEINRHSDVQDPHLFQIRHEEIDHAALHAKIDKVEEIAKEAEGRLQKQAEAAR